MIQILFYILLFFSSDCFAKFSKPNENLSVEFEIFGITPTGVVVVCGKQSVGNCVEWQSIQESLPICATPLYVDIIIDEKTVLKVGYEFNQHCLDIKNSFNIVK